MMKEEMKRKLRAGNTPLIVLLGRIDEIDDPKVREVLEELAYRTELMRDNHGR